MKSNRFWKWGVILATLLLLPAAGESQTKGRGGKGDASRYPWKTIEYVTHSNPGGPQNLIGHLIVEINQKEKILPQPIVVNLKPGGGMAKAFAYLLEKKGDAHIWAGLPHGLLLVTPLTAKLPYSYRDFTPIANVAADGSVLVVSVKSPYKTIEDFIEAARKRPKELTQGGSSPTSNEAMMGRKMMKIRGVSWNFVSFKGELEAASNVIGGNIDCAFLNPTSVVDHVRAGNLRVLLAGTHQRYKEFPNAPTIKEAGLGDPDLTYRGFIGPPGMPDYAVKTLQGAARKILDSPIFQKYLDQSMMQAAWMDAVEYGKMLARESEVTRQQLIDAGALK